MSTKSVKTSRESRPRFSYISRRTFVAPRKVGPVSIEVQHPSNVASAKHYPSNVNSAKRRLSNVGSEKFEPYNVHSGKHRLSNAGSERFDPYNDDTNETITSPHLSESPEEKTSDTPETVVTMVPSYNDDFDLAKIDRTPSPIINKSSPVSDEIEIEKEPEQSDNAAKKWFNRLSPKQKTFLALFIIFLLIIAVTAAVIPPVYVYVIRQPPNQESSISNTVISACSSTTCIGQETPYRSSIVTSLYPFDWNSYDLTGYATGDALGSPAPSYVSTSYVGNGAVLLNAAFSQYIQIPYINLAQSFTIQVWVFAQGSLLGDYGIFSQCDSSYHKCLLISLRNGRFVLSFDSMNTNNYTLIGSTFINGGSWIHLSVVYDAILYQQRIYVNGIIDAVSSGIDTSYSGTSSGSTTAIGRSLSFAYGTSYFTGRIDHFVISAGTVRSACEILDDASLVAYYPFDSTATFNDYSVNLFHGIASGTTLSQGRSGQAIYFPSGASYFQAPCFTNMETSTTPISISLWINPDNVTGGGSVIHISNLQNGSYLCYDLLALTSSGALVVQLMQSAVSVNGTQGPVIPANAWTHVAVLWGATNGLRIYINGQMSVNTLSVYLGSNFYNTPQYMTLGNNSPLGQSASISCQNGSTAFVPGPYTGAIDDFRLYNRELNTQEICVLANL